MAQLVVVYWRDIPAQVIVKKGRESAKVQLTERFEKAIDRAAMRANLRDTDSYLAEWRRASPVDVSDDLQAEVDKKAAGFPESPITTWTAAELEATFDEAKLKALVESGGVESK